MPKSKTNLTKSQLAMKTRSHKSVSIALSEFKTKDIEELDLYRFFWCKSLLGLVLVDQGSSDETAPTGQRSSLTGTSCLRRNLP